MSCSAGLPVDLDRNSLYISTIPLTQGFHWALIHVDINGTATRHHWAAVTIDPHGSEGYVHQPMPYGPRMKAGQQQILAYFKIPDYVPVDVSVLRDVCASAFPRSSHSALHNRAANMNSRTWITRVLSRLLSLPQQRATDIEDFVTAHSRVFGDAFARAFLFRQPYATLILSKTHCDATCTACRTSPRASQSSH